MAEGLLAALSCHYSVEDDGVVIRLGGIEYCFTPDVLDARDRDS